MIRQQFSVIGSFLQNKKLAMPENGQKSPKEVTTSQRVSPLPVSILNAFLAKIRSWRLAYTYVIEAADWTYDPVDKNNGPLVWKDGTPECEANRQSPINLVDDEVTTMTYDDFVFQGYDSQEDNAGVLVSISNLGHTARIAIDGIFRISGGGLPTEYQAAQAHFHWGTISQQGSEHAINGRLFPLEMHIVHYDYQQYNFTIRDAATSGNKAALAVLGILFEIDDEDNEYFDEVITGISNIEYEGEEYTFQREISLSNLLPEDTSRFYRYDGSLTTPPCYEVVQWTVFEETVKISERQMNNFRRLEEGLRNESHPVGNTYRPLQPRSDRVVYYSGEVQTCDATTTKPLRLLAVTVAILLFLLKEM